MILREATEEDLDGILAIFNQVIATSTAVGRLPQVGAKFGRWIDLVFVQRTISAADRPGT